MNTANDYKHLSDYFGGTYSNACCDIEAPAEDEWQSPGLSFCHVRIAALLDYSGCIDSPADHQWSLNSNRIALPSVCQSERVGNAAMLARDSDTPPSLQEAAYELQQSALSSFSALLAEAVAELREARLRNASRNLFTVAPIDPAGRLGWTR